MAWEKRGGRTYWYHSVRGPDGSVRKVYSGLGLRAAHAERQMGIDRAARDADDAAAAALRASLGPVDELGSELDESLDRLVASVLKAAGFHRHDGSTWRRKRHATST